MKSCFFVSFFMLFLFADVGFSANVKVKFENKDDNETSRSEQKITFSSDTVPAGDTDWVDWSPVSTATAHISADTSIAQINFYKNGIDITSGTEIDTNGIYLRSAYFTGESGETPSNIASSKENYVNITYGAIKGVSNISAVVFEDTGTVTGAITGNNLTIKDGSYVVFSSSLSAVNINVGTSSITAEENHVDISNSKIEKQSASDEALIFVVNGSLNSKNNGLSINDSTIVSSSIFAVQNLGAADKNYVDVKNSSVDVENLIFAANTLREAKNNYINVENSSLTVAAKLYAAKAKSVSDNYIKIVDSSSTVGGGGITAAESFGGDANNNYVFIGTSSVLVGGKIIAAETNDVAVSSKSSSNNSVNFIYSTFSANSITAAQFNISLSSISAFTVSTETVSIDSNTANLIYETSKNNVVISFSSFSAAGIYGLKSVLSISDTQLVFESANSPTPDDETQILISTTTLTYRAANNLVFISSSFASSSLKEIHNITISTSGMMGDAAIEAQENSVYITDVVFNSDLEIRGIYIADVSTASASGNWINISSSTFNKKVGITGVVNNALSTGTVNNNTIYIGENTNFLENSTIIAVKTNGNDVEISSNNITIDGYYLNMNGKLTVQITNDSSIVSNVNFYNNQINFNNFSGRIENASQSIDISSANANMINFRGTNNVFLDEDISVYTMIAGVSSFTSTSGKFTGGLYINGELIITTGTKLTVDLANNYSSMTVSESASIKAAFSTETVKDNFGKIIISNPASDSQINGKNIEILIDFNSSIKSSVLQNGDKIVLAETGNANGEKIFSNFIERKNLRYGEYKRDDDNWIFEYKFTPTSELIAANSPLSPIAHTIDEAMEKNYDKDTLFAKEMNTLGNLLQGDSLSAVEKELEVLGPDTARATLKAADIAVNSMQIAISDHINQFSVTDEGDLAEGGIWGQLFDNFYKDTSIYGYNANMFGFAAGIERYLSKNLLAGFAFSLAQTSIDSERRENKNYMDMLVLYGGYKKNDWFFTSTIDYGFINFEETKSLAAVFSKAKYDGSQFGIRFDVGKDFNKEKITFAPQGTFRYNLVAVNSYSDDLGIKYSGQNANIATCGVGAKIKTSSRNDRRISFIPELSLFALYDFISNVSDIKTTFPNTSVFVNKKDFDRFSVETNAGLTLDFDDEISFGLFYNGNFKGDLTSHGVIVNGKYKFY